MYKIAILGCENSHANAFLKLINEGKYPEIEVKLNTEIKDLSELEADEIIVATGAVARRIPVKGADTAVEAVDYLLGNKQVGENVVIIGGGSSRGGFGGGSFGGGFGGGSTFGGGAGGKF